VYIHLSAKEFDNIEKFQSNNVKRIFGLPKRSHHSKLLKALGITTFSKSIMHARISFFLIEFLNGNLLHVF
jgi:late competence protein required for DNA uptake (superfamily II DNA/RNA helicase)